MSEEENLDEYRLTYDELRRNCAELEHKLSQALCNNDNLQKKNLTDQLFYLNLLIGLQDQIITLQLAIMEGNE